LDAAADDLFGRNAVYLFDPGSHALDASAGDDEGFELVQPKVQKQVEHRLVNTLGVVSLVNGMLRGGDPFLDNGIEDNGIEFIETERGWQMFIPVSLMVLAKLAGRVTLGLESGRNRDIALLFIASFVTSY